MIIAINASGLGNRIKAIVSCMRLDSNHAVYWVKNKDLYCNFNDLFSNKIEVKDVPPYIRCYKPWRLAVLPQDDIPEDFNSVTNDTNIFSYVDPNGRNIDIEYDRIPMSVRQEYLKYFDKLIINPDILSEVQRFSKKFDENTVSIHIRSWADDDERNQNYHRLQKFIDESKKFDEKTTFYLTSDSDYVKLKFREIYGDRLFMYDRKTSILDSRLNSFGIQEDFIEMLLLSKNSHIIGTYLSTYTEVAWWFGGATAKVVVC